MISSVRERALTYVMVLACAISIYGGLSLSWRECLRLLVIGPGLAYLYLRLKRRIDTDTPGDGATTGTAPSESPPPENPTAGVKTMGALVYLFVVTEFVPEAGPVSWYFISQAFCTLMILGVVAAHEGKELLRNSTRGWVDRTVLLTLGFVMVVCVGAEFVVTTTGPLSDAGSCLARSALYAAIWVAVTGAFRVTGGPDGRGTPLVLPFLVAVLVLFATATASGLWRATAAINHHREAEAHLRSGDHAGAFTAYEDARSANRTIRIGFVERGGAHDAWVAKQLTDSGLAWVEARPKEALEYFSRAKALLDTLGPLAGPLGPVAYRGAGETLAQLGRTRDAAYEYLAAIDAGAVDLPTVQRAVSLLHLSDEWTALAALVLRTGLSDVPEAIKRSALFPYYLGRASLSAGRSSEALTHLERAGQMDPSLGDAFYQMGRIYESSGDSSRARQAYSRAVESTPAHLAALRGLLAVHGDEGARESGLKARISDLTPSREAPARLGDKIEFLGYDLLRSGGREYLRLVFRCLEAMSVDYVVSMFGDVEDASLLPADRREFGSVNLTHRPARPTSEWRIGEVYADTLELSLAPGAYSIRFGLDTYTSDKGIQHILLNQETGDFWVRIGSHQLGRQ